MMPLVIWGTSGHASLVADIVRLGRDYEIVGFLDDIDRQPREVFGGRVLGGQEQLRSLHDQGVWHIVVAIGDCRVRTRLAECAKASGFTLATAVHPSAVVAAGVRMGGGTVCAAGSVVNPGARIGENVIVNTCASIDHDCAIDDGVHCGPGTRLAGMVRVGRSTFVGIGSAVRDRISIGEYTVIGAGSVVVRDIPSSVLAYGNPARVIRPIPEA